MSPDADTNPPDRQIDGTAQFCDVLTPKRETPEYMQSIIATALSPLQNSPDVRAALPIPP
jgi:hypothetical protein